MSRHKIIPARHQQGLAAYRAGLTVRELIGISDEIEQMHEQVEEVEGGPSARDQHEEIANAGPSLIAGFADGLVTDIRMLANSRRGITA